MVDFGCTSPNVVIICLHCCINAKFFLFAGSDKVLLSTVHEDIFGRPSIVFTREVVVDETHFRESTNVFKSIVGIDANLLYSYPMSQPMPTGLHTRYEFDADLQTFKPRQSKSGSFENKVFSFFQRLRPDCRLESLCTTGTQKMIDFSNSDGLCGHCIIVFEAMGCFCHCCLCQEALRALTEEDVGGRTRRREMDGMRRQYIEEKGYIVVEMWECEWWEFYKTDVSVKEYLRGSFPYKRPLRQDQLLDKIKSGTIFGHSQCDIEVPEHLRENLANFPPLFKNTNVSR